MSAPPALAISLVLQFKILFVIVSLLNLLLIVLVSEPSLPEMLHVGVTHGLFGEILAIQVLKQVHVRLRLEHVKTETRASICAILV